MSPQSAAQQTRPHPGGSRFVRWFRDIALEDIPLVGGKNASLGEMYRELKGRGIEVPDGFAITADGYRHFLDRNALESLIGQTLGTITGDDVASLRAAGQRLRDAMMSAELPDDLREEIIQSYERLGEPGEGAHVAVRSSATAEDLPDASFAGQQETYLNVQGRYNLLDAVKRCLASLFTDRAISYRRDKGFTHHGLALSVGVQQMVRADIGSSGVMFTIDTESGFQNVVLINSAYGLGENVVKGTVNPDEFSVFKPTLKSGCRPILRKMLGTKELKLVYDAGSAGMVRNVPVPAEDRIRFSISDDEVLQLARWACLIEEHYSTRRGTPTPMDIEWARDGRTGRLFVLQARPETVQSRRHDNVVETYILSQRGRVLTTGRSVGEKIAAGNVRVITSARHLEQFREGEVLVTDKTDPDWEPIMKKAAAIVTNRGGRTCHAAIVSRELGVPAIVGTHDATEVLGDGKPVTVSCAEGDAGHVYEGSLTFTVSRTSMAGLEKPRTAVMLIIGNPEEALSRSFLPNSGVGLARMEFIISNWIGIHPLALLDYARLADSTLKARIDELTRGYDDKPGFFVEKLAEGIAMIAAAFHPKDVILRLSDFKTNEYAGLIGGAAYEPKEENPMLGFRGAARYYHPRYRDGFALECRAVRKVREEMGLSNLKVMIPFCRTVEEGRRVQAEMEKHGLKRGENGLELYVMCEIPSNVILADEFADIFDGFSIGSNDLTQLILGVDRDSEIVAPIFDERNPAVKRMIADVIRAARNKKRKIGICGQAPSDYPEFAAFLVEHGIDSISLNPDAVLKTTLTIIQAEKALGRAPSA